MTRNRTVPLAVLAAVSILAGAVACGRKPGYVSAEGRYAVFCPAPPSSRKEVVNTPDGPVTVHTETFSFADPAAEYWVVYIDYPETTVRNKGSERILAEARDGSLSNVNGRLLADRDAPLGGNPGREIDYQGGDPEGLRYRSRLVLSGNRLFVVLVVYPGSGPIPERAETFMQSFQLR